MKFFLFFIIVFISFSCISEECNYDTDCKNNLVCLKNKCETPKNECETDIDCIDNNRCGVGIACKCEEISDIKICRTYNPCKINPCKTEHQTVCNITTSSNNGFYECLCDDKYTDEDGVCKFDCSDKENTHTNSNNNGCSCNPDYYPNNDICQFNCKSFPFKETNNSNDGCVCKENYEDISGECKFICTDTFSHINETNDGCVCNDAYLKDENGVCKFDCSDDPFSKVNETNNECICITEEYRLKNGLCSYICPENGVVNSENNGCICNTGYHFEGELCVSNTETTICNEVTPDYATSNIVEVQRVWNPETGWGDIPDCEWSCNDGYAKTEDSCIFSCGNYGVVNSENNGCICNENYLYSEEDTECRYNCGLEDNIVVNSSNDGCTCLNNLAINDNNECYCEDFYTNRDHNDTTATASLLLLENDINVFDNLRLTKFSSENCVLQDHSYFKINLEAGKKLLFLLDFTHAVSDIDMKLFKNGIQKKSSAGTSNTESFTYQAGDSDEELILDIYSFNHRIANYKLTITKLCASNIDCNDGLVCVNDSCIQNSCEGIECGTNEACSVISATQYQCNCMENYFKENNQCITPCQVGSCGDHGVCNATSSTEYSCNCEDNYFENQSKICVTPCEVDSCGEHGVCNATSTEQYSCNCEDNYFEDQSRVCVSPCLTLSCNENEECYSSNAYYAECRCSDGFYLNENSVCVNSCENIDCGENKNCTSLNSADYSCSCNDGFYEDGENCVIRPSCEDRYTIESLNSSSSTAKTLHLTDRVTILNGLSNKKLENGQCTTAEDWYRFLVPENSKLKIDLSFIHANGDVDINLYKSDNLGVYVGHSGGVSNSEHISYSVVNEGIYYIKVYLHANDYDMKIQIIPSCNTISDCDDENYCINNECTYCNDICETNQGATGVCTNITATNYQCECNEGYFETTTHKCVNPCNSISCFENASCNSSSYNQYSCVCDDGYVYSNTLYKCILDI